MNIQAQDTPELVFGYVLEVLTTGLYPNKLDVIREYVQNSYDSIKDANDENIETDRLIQIIIQDRDMLIFDKGLGMDGDGVNKYLLFGYSEKEMGARTGFRGIGRLAGLSAAKELVVISSKYGQPNKTTLKFEAGEMLKLVTEGKAKGENYPLKDLIMQYTSIISDTEDPDLHYTIIQMLGITKDSEVLLNEQEVIKSLGQTAPVTFDPEFLLGKSIEEEISKYVPDYFPIKLTVNNKSVYKPFKPEHGLTAVEYLTIPGQMKDRLAFVWYATSAKSGAISDDSIKGIRVRFKGFGIGNEDLLKNVLFSPGRAFVHYWWVGEIYVLGNDLIPSSARDNFEQNQARDLLHKQLKLYLGDAINKKATSKSDINSTEKDLNQGHKLIKSLNKEMQKGVIAQLKNTKIKEVNDQLEKLDKKAKKVKKVDPLLAREVENTKNKLEAIKVELRKTEHIINPCDELGLKGKERIVYEVCVDCISEFFNKENLERRDVLIEQIYKKLQRKIDV